MNEEVILLPSAQSVPSASELRAMSPDRRAAIMEEAAGIAEALYRDDPTLTDFEAFEAEKSDGEATSKG